MPCPCVSGWAHRTGCNPHCLTLQAAGDGAVRAIPAGSAEGHSAAAGEQALAAAGVVGIEGGDGQAAVGCCAQQLAPLCEQGAGRVAEGGRALTTNGRQQWQAEGMGRAKLEQGMPAQQACGSPKSFMSLT